MTSHRVPPQMRESPAERRLRAVRAGNLRAATAPSLEAMTAPARKGFESKFVKRARELHPDASPDVIARVADNLRRAHFAALGKASAAARRRSRASGS
ncbi:hypothetical protein [Parafrankia sp. FMc2]|uniref:hypothetical protein n=1 Tax=Parafrankia sp. FMc2 TaxID=3233196 RepID=UPI0034D435C4